MNLWTINVENFGKIKRASVDISPLTIFVGNNNSGKSYLSMLIWGLMTFSIKYGLYDDYEKLKNTKEYLLCDEKIKKIYKLKSKYLLNQEICESFINFLNVKLSVSKCKIVEKIFNYSINIDELFISNFVLKNKYEIELNDREIVIFRNSEKIFEWSDIDKVNSYEILLVIVWQLLLDKRVDHIFSKTYSNNRPIYLPASRTGFMYAYRTILEGSIQKSFSSTPLNDDTNDMLTLPTIKFLRDLTRFSNEKFDRYNYKEIGNFIENNVLKGQIRIDESLSKTYKYVVNDSVDLPLYISSSLVSELAPFIMYLKCFGGAYKTMFIEEPESHLHLEMQMLITRTLIKLVNKGLNLVVTTHSDSVIHQINDSIKLFTNKTNKKVQSFMHENNYNEDELLDFGDVSIYQFDVENNETTVKKLDSLNTGIKVNTFNSVLTQSANQTVSIMEAIIDDED